MERARILLSCAAGVALLGAAACGSGSSSSSGGGSGSGTNACATGNGPGPWGWPGDAKTGYLPKHEPDVNCDGKVVIGILSPGDTNDHGYYESFVDTAKSFAQANGWQVITVDKINPADAVTQARNLCRQHVDMVAVGDSILKDAIPVAQEPDCKNTVWYVNGGGGVKQGKFFLQSDDIVPNTAYASGYAAGLLMKQMGVTKAGFVTGPELDFTIQFSKVFKIGMQAVVPGADLLVTYTGDFNDSGKAVEAARAQIAQGARIMYPYLGGATFAVATEAQKTNIPVLTPGTDNCSVASPKFAISVIFSPGDFFGAALPPFKNGTLRVGVTRIWIMGKDPVPTVRICNPTGDQQQQVDTIMKQIGTGQLNPTALAGG